MTKVLVLYYSTYGHIETMAKAIAEGAGGVTGTEVTIKRVPELMPEDVARKAGVKLDQAAPIAKPEELADYDAVIFGTPTRFGNMASQMRNFLDQTGGLWMKGALVGSVAWHTQKQKPTRRERGVGEVLRQQQLLKESFADGESSSELLHKVDRLR